MKTNKIWGWFWIALGVLYFFVPLYATLQFSLKAQKGQLSLGDFPEEKAEPLTIIVDHREFNSGVVRELSRNGSRVVSRQLPVGDFILSDRVAVERKEVKAFNVAEAGIDAGMLALKLEWPETSATPAAVDETALRSEFDSTVFRDPSRSSPSEFLDIQMYDNLDPVDTEVTYDSNGDDRMWVDSKANVDDDRHRILILAQRECWNLTFPYMAMYAASAGANGQGLRVYLDPNQGPIDTTLYPTTGGVPPARWGTTLGKGVKIGPGIVGVMGETNPFSSYVDAALINALRGIAQGQGSYFDNVTTTPDYPSIADGITFLKSSAAGDKVVYMKSTDPIIIAGNTQLGSRAHPIVLVLDSPGNMNALDFRGTADFYGVVINLGDMEVRGTSSFWGAVMVQGVLDSKGGGSSPEINYNEDVIDLINGYYTISVAIVPNTWEEYTVAEE